MDNKIKSAQTLIASSRKRAKRAVILQDQVDLTIARNMASVSSSIEMVRRCWPKAYEMPIFRAMSESVDNPIYRRLDNIWERVDGIMASLNELTGRGGGHLAFPTWTPSRLSSIL